MLQFYKQNNIRNGHGHVQSGPDHNLWELLYACSEIIWTHPMRDDVGHGHVQSDPAHNLGNYCMDVQRSYGFSQWETILQCNVVPYWLSPYPESFSYVFASGKLRMVLLLKVLCTQSTSWLWLARHSCTQAAVWLYLARLVCIRAVLCLSLALYQRTQAHDDVIKWKIFPRYWPFARGIPRSPVNSPHKGQWRGAFMFSLICVWINGWVNNGEAGDFRRRRAHYGVTVMCALVTIVRVMNIIATILTHRGMTTNLYLVNRVIIVSDNGCRMFHKTYLNKREIIVIGTLKTISIEVGIKMWNNSFILEYTPEYCRLLRLVCRIVTDCISQKNIGKQPSFEIVIYKGTVMLDNMWGLERQEQIHKAMIRNYIPPFCYR